MYRAIRLSIVAALLLFWGCDDAHSYRLVPRPVAETPTVNPPLAVRQTNWLGGPKGNEGSCVHASLSTMLHWQNQFEIAKEWRARYNGGEWSSRLQERLTAANIRFAFTEKGNLGLLDFAHNTRRGALLWWKPSHCCTFCGWVQDADGKTYAVILDNNSVQRYELVERGQFHRLWAGYGGFALTTLFDPVAPPPHRTYERIP